MMFADDIVFIYTTIYYSYVLEGKGLSISRSMTEYIKYEYINKIYLL